MHYVEDRLYYIECMGQLLFHRETIGNPLLIIRQSRLLVPFPIYLHATVLYTMPTETELSIFSGAADTSLDYESHLLPYNVVLLNLISKERLH